MTVTAAATHFNMTTEQLFLRAYEQERGFIYGLAPPKDLHKLWQGGLVTHPLYVERYIQHRLTEESRDEQQLLPFDG